MSEQPSGSLPDDADRTGGPDRARAAGPSPVGGWSSGTYAAAAHGSGARTSGEMNAVFRTGETAIEARAIESRDPATGEVWRRYAAASADDVAAAVARARRAQPAWAALAPDARAAVLEAFRGVLYQRRHEVAALLSRETGKPAVEALAAEVLMVLDQTRFHAKAGVRLQREPRWFTPASVALWRKRVRISHVPYGVVGVVSPWNYPFMLAAGIVLPALMTGNAVVLKPSEFTPATGLLLGALLTEAGLPEGVLEVVIGDGRAGAALTAAAVDKLFFTGSAATGRRVAHACAERLIPCSLELGGSDPALVLDDADVEQAAAGIVWGRFSNAGQTCVAPKRVYVAEAIADRFEAALVRRVTALRVGGTSCGSDADVGPLIRPSQARALRAQLDDALARGARVLGQAPLPAAAAASGGRDGFFAPVVLVGATPDMRVLREETFGPLLPVLRVRDDADAIAQANASEFGLSASVWSTNAEHAERVAMQLEAGTVAINDVAIVAGMADVPHGGVKGSGLGRAHGLAGLMECVHTRTVVSDRFARWRQPWWFGYSSARYGEMDGVLQAVHGPVAQRAGGVRGALRLLFGKRPPGGGGGGAPDTIRDIPT